MWNRWSVARPLGVHLSAALKQPQGQILPQIRSSSSEPTERVLSELIDKSAPERTDLEWINAKKFADLPGPTRFGVLYDFRAGGELHNKNFVQINHILRERYGDIFLLKGMFGQRDTVFTYNVDDFEVVYRNEGAWPIRVAMMSFDYHRKVKRPEIFKGYSGLVTEHGQNWAYIRNKVNPVMMKTQVIRQDLPEIDRIATEFVDKLETLRDAQTGHLTKDFEEQLKMWSFESITYIALNQRLNVISGRASADALKLAQSMTDFLNYSFKYDLQPSLWKYYETPGFKRLMRTYDSLVEITSKYIDVSMQRFAAKPDAQAKSVFEKLLLIDKHLAFLMGIDMLSSGMDTTTSAFLTMLYHIARNPDKQAILRRELIEVMPTIDTPLTTANTKNLPYLRACFKEGLRITPIAPGNLRTLPKDLVLSGYRVPRGTSVHMGNMVVCNSEKYFPQSQKFLPERWLKRGAHVCPEVRSNKPFVYTPFGYGARTCVGKRIAEMEIETLLARLFRRYHIEWDSKEEMKYISNLIMIPKSPLKFKFTPVEERGVN